jgi:hypothetical protein
MQSNLVECCTWLELVEGAVFRENYELRVLLCYAYPLYERKREDVISACQALITRMVDRQRRALAMDKFRRFCGFWGSIEDVSDLMMLVQERLEPLVQSRQPVLACTSLSGPGRLTSTHRHTLPSSLTHSYELLTNIVAHPSPRILAEHPRALEVFRVEIAFQGERERERASERERARASVM